MTDDHTSFRSGIDRMDHPLSHTAAVVAGVAFIVVAGCGSLALSDPKVLRSMTWWSWFSLAAGVLAVCLIAYFRPGSRAVWLPVFLAGGVTLVIWVMQFFGAIRAEFQLQSLVALLQSTTFMSAWTAWAARTYYLIRRERRRVREGVYE